jgi:O-antigen ligase
VALFVSLFVLVNVGYLFFATHNFNPMSGGDKIRVEIYKYSDILLRNNPVSGVGLGGFEDRISKISENNASFQLYAMSYALHPHNLFLAIWLSTGIAGLVIFIFILASIFKRLFTSDSRLRSYFVAAIVAILIHGVFDTTYFKNDLAALFWLIYSGAVILGNLNEEQISEN